MNQLTNFENRKLKSNLIDQNSMIQELEKLLKQTNISQLSELIFLESCLVHHSSECKTLLLLIKIFNKFQLTDNFNNALNLLKQKSLDSKSNLDIYIESLTATKQLLKLSELCDNNYDLSASHPFQMAKVFLEFKLPQKAIKLLNIKKIKDPKNFRVYQLLHQIYLEQHKYLAAEYLMQEFNYHLPKMVPMHTLLVSKCLKTCGETDNAIDFFCSKLDIENLTPNLFNFLFECLIDRGELELITKIISANSDNFIKSNYSSFLVARYFISKNDFISATELLDLIKDTLKPRYETFQFLNILAQTKLRQFKYDEAYQVFIDLLAKLNRKDKNCFLNLGFTLTMQNKLTEAREYFDLTWIEDQKKENPNKNNINQYLYGRLWNEIALNTFANQKIELALTTDNIDDSLKILREVVLEEPHYTGGYLHYLSRMRLSGKLEQKQKRKSENYIPQTIIQYWDDEDELAPDLKFITNTWKHHNPNWEYILFNDRTAIAFIGRHFPRSVLIAYMRCEKAAMKSDLFRLCYLAINGGVYADTDDRCNQPLDQHLAGYKLVVFQDRWGAIANNFIAAEPRCPTIIRALNEVVQNILDDPNDAIWYSTGPGVTSQCVAHTIASHSSSSETPSWLCVLTLRELYDFVWPHTKNAYKSTSKHWLNNGN